MSDIKQIRLNDKDYNLRDTNITIGEIESAGTIRFTGDVVFLLLKTNQGTGGIIAYSNETAWGASTDTLPSNVDYGYEDDAYYFDTVTARYTYKYILIGATLVE